MNSYDVLKDFAGPFVTIVAAFAAAYFAWAQKRIAREKLRLDMYLHLRKVYDATKELITIASNTNSGPSIDTGRIRNLYVLLDEGRFYFNESMCEHLQHIHDLCEQHFEMLWKAEEAARGGRVLDEVDRDRAVAITAEFRRIYADLPKRFETALKFQV